MNEKKYRGILYFIVVTMLLTVAVQCYWNYNNYRQNKQRYINDVQIALDNALDNYYGDLAQTHPMPFTDTQIDSVQWTDSLKNFATDSIFSKVKEEAQTRSKVRIIRDGRASDSLKMIKGITAIFISIHDDFLNLNTLHPWIRKELQRKDLNIDYGLKYFKNDSLYQSFKEHDLRPPLLITESKTKFLKRNERLEMAYPDATGIILKAGMLEIFLSLLLTLAIVSCLFYLLKIIKDQKQLAEVKNDLIGNVTHEFKTPIATISVALESIQNFNVINDREKTKSYIDMSRAQLGKLHVMVEKLLETATLDSENLRLNKESVNIAEMLKTLIEKHRIQAQTKQIVFQTDAFVDAFVDAFHFENALNNVLDNAVKYGGDNICISLQRISNGFEISISDNGQTLTKAHKEVIFEKFYRVPKGNTHNVKGFGIGLYYTKKIIEKHGGTIALDLGQNLATFKISVPHATA